MKILLLKVKIENKSEVKSNETETWNKRVELFFKWFLISLPIVAVTCIGQRIVGLIREILTFKGIALVVASVLAFQTVDVVKTYIAHENSPERVQQKVEAAEKKTEAERQRIILENSNPQVFQMKIEAEKEQTRRRDFLFGMLAIIVIPLVLAAASCLLARLC